MMKFLGFRIFTAAELELSERLSAQRLETAEKLAKHFEGEMDYYKKKFDEAQERADHQLDEFLTANGMGEVTVTGRREKTEANKKEEELQKKREKEISELFSETINTAYDEEGLELPPELMDAAEEMMKKAS